MLPIENVLSGERRCALQIPAAMHFVYTDKGHIINTFIRGSNRSALKHKLSKKNRKFHWGLLKGEDVNL